MTGILRDPLTVPDTTDAIGTAVVHTVHADGTVTVDLGGDRLVAGCLVAAWWTPSSGTAVQVARRGQDAPWMVLGPTRTSNPTTVDLSIEVAFPYNVTPGASTAPNPLQVNAIDAAAYRGGWETGQPKQGAYSGFQGYGFFSGAYFYGASLEPIRGRRCTSLSVRIARDSQGGSGGGVPTWLALHAHPDRPGGAPYFVTDTLNAGALAWGATGELALPIAWGQALIDRTAWGVGHLYQGTADYSVYKSLAQDGMSGRLTIGWA